DGHVTGVQTCALPIWAVPLAPARARARRARARPQRRLDRVDGGRDFRPAGQRRTAGRRPLGEGVAVLAAAGGARAGGAVGAAARSEERRVGKACRWWG